MTKIEPRSRAAGRLDDGERRWLLDGLELFEPFGLPDQRELWRWGGKEPSPDTLERRRRALERARAAWEAHRTELVQYWTQDPEGWSTPQDSRGRLMSLSSPKPAGPGHRPFGWWEFDAPAPRAVLDRIPYDGDRWSPPWDDRDQHFGIPWAWHDTLTVESEPGYLRRYGFLSEAEAKALDPAAFEPEICGHRGLASL